MLAKKNRIHGAKRIEWLMKKGDEYRTPCFIFRYIAKKAPPSAFAILISKNLEKKAVKRNLIRRQAAEAIRINLYGLKCDLYVMAIAKPAILVKKFPEIAKNILQFFNYMNSDAK